MTVFDQIALVVTWLNALDVMSDEDFINNDYWNSTITSATGGNYISDFVEEIGIIEVERNTAIAVLKNFYLTLMIDAFAES